MYQRILVPLDGTDLAEAILPHATALAQRFQATLVCLRVSISQAEAVRQTTPADPIAAVPIGADLAGELVDAFNDAAQRYLRDVLVGLEESGVSAEALVMDGDPVLAMRYAVTAQNIDLVTMATHGRSALGRLVQGSVAENLLHEIGVPMLLLHIRD